MNNAEETLETDRVASVRALRLLDTPPEERFDRIARLAQRTFGVPFVGITLIDDTRVWFKSRIGIAEPQLPRDGSFCDDTIQGDSQLVVGDASKDPRFAKHPLVAGGPMIRFYGGQPLKGPDGRLVGTMSLLDTKPRELDNEQRRALRDLAEMAEEQLATASPGMGAPADEHSRLLARLRMSPAHSSARYRLRFFFVGLMLTLLVATGLNFRLAHRLVSDAERLAPLAASISGPERARAEVTLGSLRSTARFFRVGIGARALLAMVLLFVVLVIFDRHMDARLSAMAAVELDSARLKGVIDAIGDGVVVADAAGRFTVFNPAAERILGLGLVNEPDQTDRFYRSFFEEGGAPCLPDMHPLARAILGQSVHGQRLIVRNERRPGGVSVVVTATPMHSFDGAPAGGVIIFRDVL